jgi:general secretion pathway protein E
LPDRPKDRINTVYLLQLLNERKLLPENLLREIKVKEGQQRGRILLSKRERYRGVRRHDLNMEDISPIEIIASFNYVTDDDKKAPIDDDFIARLLADELKLPFFKIDPLKLDIDLITKTISRSYARKHKLVPLDLANNVLAIAVTDPFNHEPLDSIRRHTGYTLDIKISPINDVARVITEFYGFKKSVSEASKQMTSTIDLGNLEQYVKMKTEREIESGDQHIINAVEYMLNYAYDQRASDIHIEPKRNVSQIRLRIDGILHDFYKLPKEVHQAIVNRIKTLCRMDIAERRKPQDGRIKTEKEGREIELRISSLPVAFGEKMVIRIFDPDMLIQDLSDMGMFDRDYQQFMDFLSHTNGLILVTGPTGSGKTTTLYSSLKAISNGEINISTIEDPIEMVYEEFNQTAVNRAVDLTFSSALRTLLRQDPDVIMVGEIRDNETAENAIQAAQTGHLVFSTLHTNDAASSITRLYDLDIEPFLISSTLLGVVAQRLVRKICPHCKVERVLTIDQIGNLNISVPEGKQLKVFEGEGCVKCRGTGYLGRSGIFEVLNITDEQRRLISERSPAEKFKKVALRDGMMTLRNIAIKRMLGGVTTFEEVIRVTSEL